VSARGPQTLRRESTVSVTVEIVPVRRDPGLVPSGDSTAFPDCEATMPIVHTTEAIQSLLRRGLSR
jgi:hypothetical protein